MSMSFAFILRNSHRPTCPWANATDISIQWAADAWYFVHSAAALLAFTAFAIACIVIVGIKQVNCAVRDQLFAISVQQCPVSPRQFPT